MGPFLRLLRHTALSPLFVLSALLAWQMQLLNPLRLNAHAHGEQCITTFTQFVSMMNKEQVQTIRTASRLDDKLLKYEGVIGVDVDYKRVKGQRTDKFSIIVYVKQKLPKEELSADETIPTEIEGIATDVVECSNVWPST